ncbi:MAG: hypothetical protein ACTSVF_04645 [Candidatus Asgardarchaeia archaeon]
MYFPDEERIRKIRKDIEIVKKAKVDPLKVAGELIDFVVKIRLKQLREKHPDATEEELIKILRKNVMELEERWRVVLKGL